MKDFKFSQWCCFLHCFAPEDDVTTVPRNIRNHLPLTALHPRTLKSAHLLYISTY